MISLARRRHRSTWNWLLFNAWVALNVLFWTPLEELFLVGVVAFWWIQPLPVWAMIACTPGLYLTLNAAHAALICGVKWIAIGRFREGNYPFYGRFHYKWVMLMSALDSVSSFLESLHGTVFSPLFNRTMGARVGRRACLWTDGLEADLLTVDDDATVNLDCDITCHTVENMVLKLARVRLGRGSTLRSYSVVMPGGTLEAGSVLLEQSQVLKGETVPANQVWAG